jgi:hypothetical protein
VASQFSVARVDLWRNYRIEEEVVVILTINSQLARQRPTRFCAAAAHSGN